MTRFITQIGFKKLAAAAIAALTLAPVAQAGDRDRVDFGFSVNDGRVAVGFGYSNGRDRFPAPHVDRVWVEPVYRTECQRVWVEPVYRTVCERVWVPPVTRDLCERVWVEAQYEYREVVRYERGRRVIGRERVCVSPGHWEERRSQVVVCEGRWDNVEKQVLVSAGHWENVERQVLVSAGHWEERRVHDHGAGWKHDRGHDRGYDRGDRYRG